MTDEQKQQEILDKLFGQIEKNNLDINRIELKANLSQLFKSHDVADIVIEKEKGLSWKFYVTLKGVIVPIKIKGEIKP